MRMPRIMTKQASGFSTVELIVAMTVLGIMMLGFLTVFPLGMRSVQKGERISKATSLVQDEIERIKALTGDDLDLAAGDHIDGNNPIDGVYTRTWSVIDNQPMPGMKTVSVAVAYSDNGHPRTIDLTTYLNP